jgi:putative ABC transport system permease protein
MLQGRDFSRDFKSDSAAVVINRVALDRMELKNPLGEKLKALGQEFTIIGVMENIIIDSPYEPILPLAMFFIPQWSSTISVRTQKTDDLPASIEKIESVFKKYVPFSYRFADTEFAAKFAAINLIGTLAKLFAALAVIITCLGLFGLAAFTTEKRTKEIGIRKVMGASVLNLVALISKDFSRIVLFAFVISAPIAWWTLNNFLERYPYRIEMSLWIFLVVGLIALTLTLLIVSTQALKAATTNPVKSLRNE